MGWIERAVAGKGVFSVCTKEGDTAGWKCLRRLLACLGGPKGRGKVERVVKERV